MKTKEKFPKKFDQGNNVRAIARERIGIVPSSKTFRDTKRTLIDEELDILATEDIADWNDDENEF